MNPLGANFLPLVHKHAWLKAILRPMQQWYVNAAGWRRMGLRADDLIVEETDIVQKALGRLTEKESYDRVWRIRRAFQASMNHKELDKEDWTRPEDDVHYLRPHIEAVMREEAERKQWDSIGVKK